MKLKLLLVPVLALAGILGVSSYAGASPVPQTRTINVGGGGSGVAANGFFPNLITINKGDTINFSNPYEELHTATFVPQNPPTAAPALLIGPNFNPLAQNPTNTSIGSTDLDPHEYYNSGFLFKGDADDVTFNLNGSYNFLCLLHPGMEVTVNVVQEPITIDSQETLDALGVKQRDRYIGAGVAITAAATTTKVTDSSGASTWDIAVGATEGLTDVMLFLPAAPLKISTGDTVKWTSPTDTPHTVTFGDAPSPINDAGTGFGAGAFPAGGSTYSGGYANSGVMDRSGAVPGGSSYSLTFTKAGTYTYVCLLHADQGMANSIIVSDSAPPASKPIAPPNTGSGPAGTAGSWLPALLILGIAGIAFVVTGTRTALKQKA